jgi:hypothetical protein
MTTANSAFALYIALRLREHASALRDAAYFRCDVRHPAYLAHAANIRAALAADLARHKTMAA